MLFDFGNGDIRANRPGILAGSNLMGGGQVLHVHEQSRAGDVVFHLAEDVDAARQEASLISGQRDSAIDAVRGGVLERLHAVVPTFLTLPSAASTRAGVMGRLLTRTPMALATALAIAAAVGMVAGSPMPITPRSGMSIKITSISGTSAKLGSLYVSKLGFNTTPVVESITRSS